MGPGRSGVLALVEASARDEADAKGALDGGEAQEFQNGSVSVKSIQEGDERPWVAWRLRGRRWVMWGRSRLRVV